MALKNPYTNRTMIPIDSDIFFGREKEMRRIMDLISGDNPQSVSIIGERRIGKSSLAWRLFHKIKEQNNTYAVYLDCDELAEECETKEHFFKELNWHFLADNSVLKNTGEDLFKDYPSFKTFIKNNGQGEKQTIIFLDEFEHLPGKEFADDTFFSNLRSMANNPTNRLAFVAISKTPLKELTHDSIQTSTFWNIFIKEIIGLLEHGSIEALRQKGFENDDLTLSKEDNEKIHYYTGDFPFFNQLACDFVWRSSSPLNWHDLEDELFSHYQELWKNRKKSEKKLLKRWMGIDHLEDPELINMWKRGLLIQAKKGYAPFSAYFSQLLDSKLKIPRKKWSLKTVIQYIKDALDIGKAVKDLLKGEES